MSLLARRKYNVLRQNSCNSVLRWPGRVIGVLCVFLFVSFSISKAQDLAVYNNAAFFNPYSSYNPSASITATATGGPWNDPLSWTGGVVPSSSDDVTIPASATITVDANSLSCQNLSISGSLIFSGAYTLNVFGDWTNNGTFTASTGTVSFKGASNTGIGGISPSVFNNITVDKGTNISSILDANGIGAI